MAGFKSDATYLKGIFEMNKLVKLMTARKDECVTESERSKILMR